VSWFSGVLGGAASVPDHVPSPEEDRGLVLYGRASCPYCIRVYRELERLDVGLELRDTGGGSAHRQELRERTGRTQVPCLFIDDQPLFESADIVAWLRAYSDRPAN